VESVWARLVVNRVHWRGRITIRRSSSSSSGERSLACVVFATRVRPAETKGVSREARKASPTRGSCSNAHHTKSLSVAY
jgi:hypothetical protein